MKALSPVSAWSAVSEKRENSNCQVNTDFNIFLSAYTYTYLIPKHCQRISGILLWQELFRYITGLYKLIKSISSLEDCPTFPRKPFSRMNYFLENYFPECIISPNKLWCTLKTWKLFMILLPKSVQRANWCKFRWKFDTWNGFSTSFYFDA